MNLLEVRQMFVKLSGRYDLIIDTTDWVDNGANFFIQSGQNMIEKLVGDLPESEGRIWKTVVCDEYYMSFQKRCRAIFQVWASNGDGRNELIKISWDDMKDLYTSPIAEVSSARPIYFCPAKLREVDATDKNASGIFDNFSLSISSDFRGILFMPPADTDYDIEIRGKFLQPALSIDNQENFWTLTYPEILIQAAIYRNELSYRGKDSVSKLLASIMLDIESIDKDMIEETSYGISQVRG